MHNLRVLPYQMASESARDLAKVLNVLRIREGGTYRPKMSHLVVNWGSSLVPTWNDLAQTRGVRILNKPTAVGIAANKLKTLQTLSAAGVRVPAFTTFYQEAQNWFNQGYAVVERHKLNGHSGEGIRISFREGGANANTTLGVAPLYTKYIHKSSEFRVHVFRGQVIDYIQKKKRTGAEQLPNFNKYIYSTELGWVFARGSAEHLASVKDLGIKAVAALGLDFGAVDIVVIDNVPYVLEVNSAPGLAGTTLINYANAIRQFMGAGPVSQEIVNQYVTGRDEPITERVETPHAAIRAQAVQGTVLGDLVTLQLDRQTARTLKQLLNQLAL